MASQVEIHLPIQQSTITEWIHAFTIPTEAIKRFTFRPLKWLRFATFAVCGAKGQLHTGDGIIDYDDVTFDDLANKYFYFPENEYHFVDFAVFNDRCTSTTGTPRVSNFHVQVSSRDVGCVITGSDQEDCHASHIIPRCKGDNYLSFILRDRSSLYDDPPLTGEDIDINCIKNGILLRTDLHTQFDKAKIGFLKTPNFAMTPADVPRVEDEDGPIPDKRTTLHYIVPPLPEGRGKIPQWDFLTDWSPPSILLDFMYGAAIVNRWKSDRLLALLKDYFETAFRPILTKQDFIPATPSLKDDEPGVEPDDDDIKDPNWEPSSKKRMRETSTSIASADFLKDMDYMLCLSMLLKGIPPEEVAVKLERQTKEQELCSQRHACEKVQQWLDACPEL